MTEPVPATGAWQEYLEAAHRLDSVRREAAATVAAEQQALRAAREELPAVTARLALQQQRLNEIALRAGAPLDLTPTSADAQAAARAVAGGPAVVLAALRQARSTVDGADAALAQNPTPQPAPLRRNLSVYGSIALAALIIHVTFITLIDDRTKPLYAGCTAFLLTLVSFGIGWIITGMVSRTRTAALGLVVCALPLALSTAVTTLLWL
jgi:hypothetical protein